VELVAPERSPVGLAPSSRLRTAAVRSSGGTSCPRGPSHDTFEHVFGLLALAAFYT
jgi:hypothetical protein